MGKGSEETQQDIQLTSGEIRQDITATLERMSGTLDAIGHRMDIPARARDLYAKKPVPVIGGGVGLVVLIGGIITAILLLRRRGRE
jgi:ornithine carbamoyltransferase